MRVAVVGDDDADGQEAVLDVGQAEEAAVLGIVAGVGGDGDVLVGVGVEGGVLGGGLGGRGFFVGGVGDGGDDKRRMQAAESADERWAARAVAK